MPDRARAGWWRPGIRVSRVWSGRPDREPARRRSVPWRRSRPPGEETTAKTAA